MGKQLSDLPGRRRSVALVREFATRPEEGGKPSTKRSPIIVFIGPKGSGKTALLDAVRAGLEENVPYARIDCAELAGAVPWEVLSFLTYEFNRTAARYGAIPFPRFVTAQAAIAEPLTLTNLAADRLSVRRALERLRRIDELRVFLQDQMTQVAEGLPFLGSVPGVVRLMPDLLLRGLVRWKRGRKVVLGGGVEFFGTGDRAYDELIRLNRLTRDGATLTNRQEAAEMLWSAFLADLRAAFDSRRGARTWSLNCVVLLDNIDTEAGLLLYNALADARREEPDPLTVVATSAGRVARHVAGNDPIPTAEEAGREDYDQRAVDARYVDAYPVALRDLDLEEVTRMVTDASQLDARRDVAESVHRFTHGHPAATALLVKAIGHQTGDFTSLRDLLRENWRAPVDQGSVTVADRMLRDFLGESPPEELVSWLELCSAARDAEQAADLVRGGLADTSPEDTAIAEELRVKDPTGRAVMMPALRNLLLFRLAATPDRWTAAHTWLRDNGKDVHRRYHALAAHDLDPVVDWLEDRLGDAATWFDELERITSAPCDVEAHSVNRHRVLEAVGWSAPADGTRRAIAEAVVALWLANDYSATHRAPLHETAVKKLREVMGDRRVVRGDFEEAVDRVAANARPRVEGRVGRTPPGHLADRDLKPTDFVPPVLAGARRARTRRRALLAAGAVVVLGAGGVVAWDQVTRCGEGVYEHGGECVGVTDGSYVFDDRLRVVQEQILEENERIADQPHVTVAVLTPLRPAEVGGSVTWERIRAQLEGAHVAQLAANKDKREPKVRLVLAHPGSHQQEWRRVVDQLVDLVGSDRLVGVVGVGQSTTNTLLTARALSAADIPMVASVVTATGFHVEPPAEPGGQPGYLKGFTRVSTTTGDQIAVLSDYLGRSGVRKAMLVYDINEDDLYTSTLRKEFKAAAARGKVSIAMESRFDTEASLATQFREIMRDLCGEGAPDTVLYAGRAVLLDDLINNLRQRGCALDKRITLVTGSDASMLRTRPDLAPKDEQPDLAVLYTPHVDPESARAQGIAEFDVLTAEFERLGFDTADLADGWGVMMHDATLAAVEAISRTANGLKPGEFPTRQSVRSELERSDRERNAVRGAGGTFRLDATTGNAVGRELPVIEVGPDGAFVVKTVRPTP